MDLPDELARRGIARTRTLHNAGHSRGEIARLCRNGTLIRPRRGWVGTPNADPRLLWAVQHGVVVTCVTQARALGLWVLDDPPLPHVAAPVHSGHIGQIAAHVHWATPLIPRHPDAVVDSLENTLALVAQCQPFETALAVWESAFQKRLVTPEAMAGYPLAPAARRIVEEASIWSDSGLETIFVPRLRWMRVPLRRQIHIAGRRVDLLIGERLVVQIDGGTHVGAQREQDIAHDAQLRLMGYHVIRVGFGQVIHRWHEVQDLIMRAVGQGLHLAR